MINNAENLGPKITVGRDQRITRVGVFLRKTKLDELPQLINVLKGDMTIVGPRPEVPEYVALYPEKIKNIVLAIRPGITDYASLLMIDESTILARSLEPKLTYINEIMPQKLDLAVKYIQERSFIIDLKIIFLTLFKIVKRS
jgi:lipopolysaccharide/colanic/teichoic acid biosynthesis glycosyltransferase